MENIKVECEDKQNNLMKDMSILEEENEKH
jgi:hypothetical protein